MCPAVPRFRAKLRIPSYPRHRLYAVAHDIWTVSGSRAASVGTDENSTKVIARQIDSEVILPSPELSACCDIANGFKHHVLHRRSYVTRTNQGHAEVVSQALSIATTIIVEDLASGTADVLHPDGTFESNVPLESESLAAAEREAGWVQDTFTFAGLH
jgi:hypothetical protein